MSERIEHLGGHFEIASADHGTTVRARLTLVQERASWRDAASNSPRQCPRTSRPCAAPDRTRRGRAAILTAPEVSGPSIGTRSPISIAPHVCRPLSHRHRSPGHPRDIVRSSTPRIAPLRTMFTLWRWSVRLTFHPNGQRCRNTSGSALPTRSVGQPARVDEARTWWGRQPSSSNDAVSSQPSACANARRRSTGPVRCDRRLIARDRAATADRTASADRPASDRRRGC